LKRTIAAYYLASVVAGGGALVLIPVWLSLMGAASYGMYAVTWAVAVAASAGAVAWIRQASIREVGSGYGARDLPWWVLVAVGLAAAAATAAVVSGLQVMPPGTIGAPAALAGSLVYYQLAISSLQRRERAWLFFASETGRLVLTAAIVLGLYRYGASGYVALTAGSALGNLLPGVLVPGRDDRLHPAERALFREWWSYGWPLSVWQGVAPLILYLDRFWLQAAGEDPAILGQFAAVSDIAVRGTAAVGGPLLVALHIRTMRAANQGRENAALALLERVVVIGVIMSLSAGLVVTVTRELLQSVLNVEQLSEWCLPLLVLGGCLWQVAQFAHKPLEIARRTRAMLFLLTISLLVETAMCAYLVGRWGATGAAVAMVSGVLAYLVLAIAVSGRRQTRIHS
jgi:O-antigen/teichoic acid export membrane protein